MEFCIANILYEIWQIHCTLKKTLLCACDSLGNNQHYSGLLLLSVSGSGDKHLLDPLHDLVEFDLQKSKIHVPVKVGTAVDPYGGTFIS